MAGIIGKKVGMTSVYDQNGKYVACTVIEAGPCVVSQLKTIETDGYKAVQIAFDEKKEKHTPKAMLGHFKKANTSPKRKLVEFVKFDKEVNLGDSVLVDMFNEGDWVDITGTTKGKGFQGVIKRHGMGGVGDNTHGQHDRLRAPGSIGASSYPSKVVKGLRMAGRAGNKRVKQINCQVIKVIAENNLLLVKGSIPGSKGSYLTIQM